MFVLEEIIDGVDATGRDVGRTQNFQPFRGAAPGELAGEQAAYIFRVCGARLYVAETFIVQHLGPPDDGREPPPVRVRTGCAGAG